MRRVVVTEALTGEVVFAVTVPVRGGVALDRTGRRLAHLGEEGEVLVHDVAAGTLVSRHRTGTPTADTVVFAPDGETVAVGGVGAVEVLHLGGGGGERVEFEGTCLALNWSGDSVRALVAADDRMTVIDGAGRVLWTGVEDVDGAESVACAFTSDGRVLVTVGDGTSAVVAWFLDDGDETRQVPLSS